MQLTKAIPFVAENNITVCMLILDPAHIWKQLYYTYPVNTAIKSLSFTLIAVYIYLGGEEPVKCG